MSASQEYARFWRALIALEGLAMGDAFGEQFFALMPEDYQPTFEQRVLPEAQPGAWSYTDDTQMALSLVEILRRHQTVDQDRLAESFTRHYEPQRGYGANMDRMLRALAAGEASWRELAPAQFAGQGSYGNGAAMRVAPLGAYFAEDLPRVVAQAHLSAEVTHSHPDAIAGAIAVAVGAALSWQCREAGIRPTHSEWIERILPLVPTGSIRDRLQLARDIAPNTSAPAVASMLGSGYAISALDTVPYVLWCAGQFLDDYEEALWQTASGRGDIDTNCAMVGGIVALYTGVEKIPEAWLVHREVLPAWPLADE